MVHVQVEDFGSCVCPSHELDAATRDVQCTGHGLDGRGVGPAISGRRGHSNNENRRISVPVPTADRSVTRPWGYAHDQTHLLPTRTILRNRWDATSRAHGEVAHHSFVRSETDELENEVDAVAELEGVKPGHRGLVLLGVSRTGSWPEYGFEQAIKRQCGR